MYQADLNQKKILRMRDRVLEGVVCPAAGGCFFCGATAFSPEVLGEAFGGKRQEVTGPYRDMAKALLSLVGPPQ